VDDLGAVEVGEAFRGLRDEVLGLGLAEPLLLFEQFVEGVVAAQFQEDVYIFVVLEDVFETDDAFMFEHFMDFDFSDELNRVLFTFCLAFGFLRFYLLIILMAHIFLVLRLVA
jgi:hypothetical protein